MKSTLTRTVVATALITVASGAFAHEDYSERGTTHWLEHQQAATSQPSERELARYGYASSGTPVRGVAVDKDTRHINVVRLETIAIRVADKTVNWSFDTLGTASFPLSKIIPGVEGVTVHVAENPMYRGR
jgi:hypothetical protein